MKVHTALVTIFLVTLAATAVSAESVSLVLDDSSRSVKLSEKAIQRGTAHYQAGEYDLAILAYDEALTLNPGDTMTWERMADARLSIGLIHDAMLSLEEAERTAVGDERKKHLLKRLQGLIEEIQAAEENYQAGLVFLETGEWNKAILNFKRAVYLNPADARYYRRTGLLLADLGLYTSSMNTFKRLLQLNDGVTADDALFLAGLLKRMGKTPDSWRVLQWGHSVFPENEELFLRVKEMRARKKDEQQFGPVHGKTRARIIRRTGLIVVIEAGYQDGISPQAAFKKRLAVYRDGAPGSGNPPQSVGEVLVTLVEPRSTTAVVREEREGGVSEGDWIVLE